MISDSDFMVITLLMLIENKYLLNINSIELNERRKNAAESDVIT